MTIRATQADVQAIIDWQDGTNGPIIPLSPFIRQANVLTNWLKGEDSKNELDEDTLTQIEVQLAAHFYSVQRDPQYQAKSTDGASGSFTGQTGMFLESTYYGQTAKLLDVTGKLAKRDLEAKQGKFKASTTWIGHHDHSEDPYA